MKKSQIHLSVALLGLIFLGACETIKTPMPSGGSKSDGIIEFSFQHNEFESPLVQWDQVLAEAQERCRAWGYKTGLPFGGLESECADSECFVRTVYSKYQCTNNNNALREYLDRHGG